MKTKHRDGPWNQDEITEETLNTGLMIRSYFNK